MKTLIGSIIVFLLVVTLHEFGHFIVAKLNNILVNEFSIGMGPKIFQKKYKETTYSIRVLPIGGYVAMEGESSSSDNERAFNNASVLKRMSVVVAGAFMNIVLAVVAFFIVFSFVGIRSNTIDKVIANSPAEIAGIRSGDKIISINSHKTRDFFDVINVIESSKDSINLEISRDGKTIEKHLKPKKEDGRNIIGITSKTQKSFISSLRASIYQTKFIVVSIYKFLATIFTGNFHIKSMSGPVGVISVIGEETSKGALNLVQILGVISANLAVINMLPIPALDGGKFLFLIVEAIRGKALNEEFERKISIASFVFLLSLMLYITIFNDLKIFN